MKKFLLLLATVAIALAAQAETLTFQMGGRDGAVILNNGKFNENGSFIGNTDGNTKIQVGEVDFGSGNVYKAASIRFANGWGGGGQAIISVGDNLETATEVCRMDLINWNDSYTNFRSLGANFTVAPNGVKKVFLTFDGRAGNIMDVRFYNAQFAADQFEDGNLLKEPKDWSGYASNATILSYSGSELIYSSNSETRIDGDSWGWTGEGVIVKYGDLDFGNGDYKQVMLELASHWQGDQHDHSVDVYIDDYNDDANMIANVWCGIDVRARLCLARNIPAISGTHTVYLKWHGGSINISNVHFVKDYLYSQGNTYFPFVNPEDPVEQDPVISANAARYSFRADTQNSSDATYVGRNSGRTRILYQGQWEDNNVGWTKDRSILRVSNVNFNSAYNELIAQYAAAGDQNPNSNLKFFIDTEINKINLTTVLSDAGIQLDGIAQFLFNAVTSGTTVDALLNDYDIDQIKGLVGEGNGDALVNTLFNHIAALTPAATVPLVRTGDWGNEVKKAGDLTAINGTHNVYIVFNANGDNGANIKDFWLNTKPEPPAPPVFVSSTLAQIKQSGADGTDYQIVDGNLTCVATYKDNGDIMLVCKDDNAAAQQLPATGQIDFIGQSYFNVAAAGYDHSNWIMLRTSELGARILKGHTLKDVKGTLTGSGNELTLTEVPYKVEQADLYTPNTYIPASFAGTQYSTTDELTYFFVAPRAGEYVFVRWANWDGSKFESPVNSSQLSGSFAADLSLLNIQPSDLPIAQYELHGFISAGTMPAGAPRRAPGDTDYVVKVNSINIDSTVITGITDLSQKSEVVEPGQEIIYDLTGRRVKNPVPGIYIMNGKKVVIK